MTTTIEISDGMARAIEREREYRGLPTLSAAAEAVLALGLQASEDEADDTGLDTPTLQALVDEALESGPPRPWSMDEVRTEIRRRYPKGQPEEPVHIVRHDRFSEDVIAAWAYIAVESPQAAERLLERIDAAIALVSALPKGRPERGDIRPPVRTLPAKGTRYVLVYRTSGDQLDLLRLIHGARDLPTALTED